MRLLFVSLLGICLMAANAQEVKKIQKFSPVFTNQQEVNDLLAFVSEHIQVVLSEDQTRNINGQMVCRFRVDTTGRIYNVSVFRGLRSWIDMAIVGAMVRLPFYGIPSLNQQGVARDVERQLVFSFGKPFFQAVNRTGFDGQRVQESLSEEIGRQSSAVFKEKRRQTAAWEGFTKSNSRLHYDGRNALKGSYPVLPDGSDVLKPSVVYAPTVGISGVSADFSSPALIEAPKE